MSNLCKQHVSAVKLPALVRLNLVFCAEVIVTDCTLELLWAALKFQVIQCSAFSLASLATMNTGENLGLKPAQYNCKGAINQRHHAAQTFGQKKLAGVASASNIMI